MIVNVSSLGGRLGITHEAAYCASKFALCGWSEGLAIDLDGAGVAVRLIEPGPIATDIWDQPGSEDPRCSWPDLEPPTRSPTASSPPWAATRFEHYLPDLKSVVTSRNPTSMVPRMAPASGTGRREGMRALVFGVRRSRSRRRRTPTRWCATWPAHRCG